MNSKESFFDSTYAYIEFSLDEKIFPIAEEIFSITPEERGIKLFRHVMENINGNVLIKIIHLSQKLWMSEDQL